MLQRTMRDREARKLLAVIPIEMFSARSPLHTQYSNSYSRLLGSLSLTFIVSSTFYRHFLVLIYVFDLLGVIEHHFHSNSLNSHHVCPCDINGKLISNIATSNFLSQNSHAPA